MTYAFNPLPRKWTATQQMSVLGKREGIARTDLIETGKHSQIATLPKIKNAIDEVIEALRQWTQFAEMAQVSEANTKSIQRALSRTFE